MLESGGLAVVPSDTAYGLAAKTTDPKVVRKIYDFKGRQFGKGISVFVKNIGEIEKYADVTAPQFELIKTILPGPFTVILKSKHKLSRELEAPDGTLGVRVIDHPFIRQLTTALNFPITATSANLAGRGPHYSVDAFLKTLSDKKKEMIDLAVDAGPLPIRKTSTLVRLAGDQVEVLREGELNLNPLGGWQTGKEAETRELAKKIFQDFLVKGLAKEAVVVILKGNLGSGKTVFAKGIGELFGLDLTSPTFVLMDEHPIAARSQIADLSFLYHLDLYRVEAEDELEGLKLEQFLLPGNLLLIEWGEKLSVFEKLKKTGGRFFLLQIADSGVRKRRLDLFEL